MKTASVDVTTLDAYLTATVDAKVNVPHPWNPWNPWNPNPWTL